MNQIYGIDFDPDCVKTEFNLNKPVSYGTETKSPV